MCSRELRPVNNKQESRSRPFRRVESGDGLKREKRISPIIEGHWSEFLPLETRPLATTHPPRSLRLTAKSQNPPFLSPAFRAIFQWIPGEDYHGNRTGAIPKTEPAAPSPASTTSLREAQAKFATRTEQTSYRDPVSDFPRKNRKGKRFPGEPL